MPRRAAPKPHRPWRRLALVVVVLAATALGAVRFAPFYLPPPDAVTAVPVEGPAEVFGYATLTDPWVRFFVIGGLVPSEPASLEGWRRVGRNVVPDPEATVEGRLFAVDAAGMRRLDRYERAGVRYERLRLELADGREAWVYRRLPQTR